MISSVKKALTVSASFMRKVGEREKELIRTDSLNGVSQNLDGRRFGQYKSEQYKKYKANWMNRFTTKTGKKKKVVAQTIEGQYRVTKGSGKLKGHGRTVSNETAFVNMTLSGQMADGLHILSVKDNEVVMSYDPKDAGKIIGNKDIDPSREVVGLNNKNIEAIKYLVKSELSKGIDDWAREDVVINISL